MLFDYSATREYLETLDLVDPGNTAIVCHGGDFGLSIYGMLIKTVAGRVHILEFGPTFECPISLDEPYSPDEGAPICEGFMLSYYSFKWSNSKLAKAINTFLNAPGKRICSAEETVEEDLKQYLPKDFIGLFDRIQ